MNSENKIGKILTLFLTFLKIGAFTFGGGYAMIPLIQREIVEKHKWASDDDLLAIVAIAESTPGPLGVNMATYVGFTTAGIPGGVIATLGLVAPALIIVLIVARFLQKFRQSKVVDGVFYGLRAASVALITAAMLQVARIALTTLTWEVKVPEVGIFYWPAILLAAVIFVVSRYTKLKKLHPICFIAFAALVGIVLKL